MLKSLRILAGAALAVAVFSVPTAARAHGPVGDIMNDVFKGKTSLVAKANKGEASKEDLAKVLEAWKKMAKEKPPRGEMASWKEKTAAGIKAAQALVDGKPNAADAFKKAANCKACHGDHKPKDE